LPFTQHFAGFEIEMLPATAPATITCEVHLPHLLKQFHVILPCKFLLHLNGLSLDALAAFTKPGLLFCFENH